MDPYATSAELNTWTGTTVADADRLLARASELLDSVIRASFTVNGNGIPTDADVAAALRDAACAQVEQWLEVGEANDIDGLAGTDVSTSGFSGRRAPSLAPRAARILTNAGLDYLPTDAELGR